MSTTRNNTTMNTTMNTIPGLCWVQNPGPWWVPAGLEQTQGPKAKPTYTRPPFFGADREYGPDEGWQIYRTRKARSAMRRNARRNADMDEYYSFYEDDEKNDHYYYHSDGTLQ